MNIEAHRPKLEALLQQSMSTGEFGSLEEMLRQILEPNESKAVSSIDSRRTGADLVAAMQAMPYKDVEFGFPRQEHPFRDVEL